MWPAGTTPSSTTGFSLVVSLDRPARLFLCAGCRVQVVLCTPCDRGNRYCSRTCWRQTHDLARREAACRYQRSRGGSVRHAARSHRWRQRTALRAAEGDGAAHKCVFRKSVTGVFGIVTDDFGNATGHFGDVTDWPFIGFLSRGLTGSTVGADVAYEPTAGHSLAPFEGRDRCRSNAWTYA